MKRRSVIAGLGAAVCSAPFLRPAVASSEQKFRWQMATTWPPSMPILQEAPERFARLVKEMSGGRLEIKVFAGGELIPPLGVFDAVSQGIIQTGVGSPYYWAGKIPAAQFFGAVPFGLPARHFNTWLQAGGGQELWEKLYEPFGVVPMTIGNTGTQMGGWYKRRIKSVQDLNGLKIRIPGLGGKVMAHLGANVVLMSGSEIYTALERNTIDATEWISPFHDERLGLYRAAKLYYYPGWQEPQSNLELIVGKRAWDSLPSDLRAIVRAAAADIHAWTVYKSEAANGPALVRMRKEHGVEVLPFPDDVLAKLRKASRKTLEELAAGDPESAKVYAAYRDFGEMIEPWSRVSEEAYIAALRA